MIFNDKSWSMEGKPYVALKDSCKQLTEIIFSENP